MTDDLDIGRYIENGTVALDVVTMHMVAGAAKRCHATVDRMAVELIRDGIAARGTRRVRDHSCRPGTINKRFCYLCSKPMDGTS